MRWSFPLSRMTQQVRILWILNIIVIMNITDVYGGLFLSQYSSLMVMGMEDETRPALLLVMLEPGGVGVVVEACGCCCFFLLIFLSLARRFWNQIFT